MPKDKIIAIVRRNLWSRGYAVKTFSDTELGFDLLVGGKVRVMVMRQQRGPGKCIGDESSPYDTVALVSFDAAKRPVILYTNAGEPTADPRVVFGLSASFSKDEKNKKTRGKKASAKEAPTGAEAAAG